MRGRRSIHRGVKHTNGRHIAGFHSANQNFPGARRCGCHVTRHPFLQQQFSPLDHWFAVKTVTQAAILQRVGYGRNCHALMMRHKAAHDGVTVVFLQPCGGKIDRFIKPVTPFGTQSRQLRIVLLGRHRINHRSQPRGIGRDYLILAQPTFQPKPGHPEIGILIRHLQIARVVGAFRYPPRHAKRRTIALLARNDQSVRLFQH